MNPEFNITTAKGLIEAWDKKEIIWSINLGGLGPGYDQTIQVAAIEFTRASLDFETSEDVGSEDGRFDAICHQVCSEKINDLTGAMYGAAKWLAWQWITIGPSALLEKAKEQGKDSQIFQVSNTWPLV